MTTPALNTPYAIIRDAFQDAGLNQLGDVPTSDQMVTGLSKLTDLVNLWQTQGLKLWLYEGVVITLVEGQSDYGLGPTGDVLMVKPLRVIQGYYLDINNIRRPLTQISWDEWNRLSQVVGNNGTVTSFLVNKQATQLSIHLWQAPSASEVANGAVHLLVQEQVTNFINIVETMDFPLEWRIALRWGLADELATGQPQAIMDRCQQRALTYRTMLEDWDVEDAPTRFTPDSQMLSYSASRFR